MALIWPPDSPFAPPSLLYSLVHHPLSTLISWLHWVLLYLRGPAYKPSIPFDPTTRPPIRVVCISDTHNKIPMSRRLALPKGDLLIHCGDLTQTGTRTEIQRSLDWLKSQQKPWPGSSDGFRHIVVVAGNHDSYFDESTRSNYDRATEKRGQKLEWGNVRYLQNSSVCLPFPGDPIRWLKVHGAPQIPKCSSGDNSKDRFAFEYPRGGGGPGGVDVWADTIPDDVDVLVTHGPPKWHLDLPQAVSSNGGGLGCELELKEVWRVKPTLHVFGHVHSGYGKEYVWWDRSQRLFEQFQALAYGAATATASDSDSDSDSKAAATGKDTGKEHSSKGSEWTNPQLWRKAAELLYEDVRGLLRTRVWHGPRQGGIMINAAMTYQTTNELRNRPQVVEL